MAPRSADKSSGGDVSPPGSTVSTRRSAAAAAGGGKSGKFTWQEVAQHNNAESAWVIVEGKAYDITPFLDKHPGGREMLLLSAGRECTALFNSYHCLTDKPRKYMAAYEIGTITGPSEFPGFAPDNGFYKTLSERVKNYFEMTQQDPKAPSRGVLRMLPVFAGFALGYAIMNDKVFPGSPFWVKAVGAVLFGLCQVLPLLHVMHDASHAAIGHNETWWQVMGRLPLDWMAGASMMQWHHQHVVGHHQYTNVYEADPDLPCTEDGDVRYLVSRQRWASVYAWQHVYLPLLYGFLAIKVRIEDVLSLWVHGRSGPVRVNLYNPAWYRVGLTKLIWAAWRIALPLYVWQIPAATYWPLFLIAEMTSGYWLAWNFEVSHISTEVDWPNGDKKLPTGGIADSWAELQVRTSVDYAHNDGVMTFLCGALNYQIEHHLFPGISQYYYPAIAPLVVQTCKEYGIPYRYERNFAAAFGAHIRYLRDKGAKGVAHKMD